MKLLIYIALKGLLMFLCTSDNRLGKKGLKRLIAKLTINQSNGSGNMSHIHSV